MLAQEIRDQLIRFGWKQIGVGDDYCNHKGFVLTITTDEQNMVRARHNPSCSQDVFPVSILSDVDLATICSGGVPAGFSATKPKVGQVGELFGAPA